MILEYKTCFNQYNNIFINNDNHDRYNHYYTGYGVLHSISHEMAVIYRISDPFMEPIGDVFNKVMETINIYNTSLIASNPIESHFNITYDEYATFSKK